MVLEELFTSKICELTGLNLLSPILFSHPLCEECPNTEFFLVRIWENTDQKKLTFHAVICTKTNRMGLAVLYNEVVTKCKKFFIKNCKRFSSTTTKSRSNFRFRQYGFKQRADVISCGNWKFMLN